MQLKWPKINKNHKVVITAKILQKIKENQQNNELATMLNTRQRRHKNQFKF